MVLAEIEKERAPLDEEAWHLAISRLKKPPGSTFRQWLNDLITMKANWRRCLPDGCTRSPRWWRGVYEASLTWAPHKEAFAQTKAWVDVSGERGLENLISAMERRFENSLGRQASGKRANLAQRPALPDGWCWAQIRKGVCDFKACKYKHSEFVSPVSDTPPLVPGSSSASSAIGDTRTPTGSRVRYVEILVSPPGSLKPLSFRANGRHGSRPSSCNCIFAHWLLSL